MRLMALLLVSFFLAGCATTYQRSSFSGGYSETRLGENVFQVYFSGNGYTGREKAADFCLLRSAEVALENGFHYFVIVDSEKNTETGYFTTPTSSYTTGSAYSSGNYAYGSATTTTHGGQTYRISKPRANNTILCFNDKPENYALIFDADFVSKSIKQKYGITGSKE